MSSIMKGIMKETPTVLSKGQARIFKDLGNGYFLGNDSYGDDDGFEKEGYTVYYQEGDNKFRKVETVSMSPYNNPPGHVEKEAQKIIANDQGQLSEDEDPCWKNYKQVGMKRKNGKEVPNCVPKESVTENDDEDLDIFNRISKKTGPVKKESKVMKGLRR